jgi:hypothetical protein
LAQALEGCYQWQRMQRQLPVPGPVTRAALRFPLLVGIILPLLPHMVGAAVSLCYNTIFIAAALETAWQRSMFLPLALTYTAIAFLITGSITYVLWAPIRCTLAQISRGQGVNEQQVLTTRRYAVGVPRWAAILSFVGWLPGGLIMPLLLQIGGPVSPVVYAHFIASFTLAGLIALPYCGFATGFMVWRVLYPFLWSDARGFRERTRQELASVRRRLVLLQCVAALVPLAGVLLLMCGSPDELTAQRLWTFRFLLTALVLLGMAGYGLALLAGNFLTHTLQALTGSDHRGIEPRSVSADAKTS